MYRFYSLFIIPWATEYNNFLQPIHIILAVINNKRWLRGSRRVYTGWGSWASADFGTYMGARIHRSQIREMSVWSSETREDSDKDADWIEKINFQKDFAGDFEWVKSDHWRGTKMSLQLTKFFMLLYHLIFNKKILLNQDGFSFIPLINLNPLSRWV